MDELVWLYSLTTFPDVFWALARKLVSVLIFLKSQTSKWNICQLYDFIMFNFVWSVLKSQNQWFQGFGCVYACPVEMNRPGIDISEMTNMTKPYSHDYSIMTVDEYVWYIFTLLVAYTLFRVLIFSWYRVGSWFHICLIPIFKWTYHLFLVPSSQCDVLTDSAVCYLWCDMGATW